MQFASFDTEEVARIWLHGFDLAITQVHCIQNIPTYISFRVNSFQLSITHYALRIAKA